MKKKCGICGEEVGIDLIQCPRCGRGAFESEKLHHDSDQNADAVRDERIAALLLMIEADPPYGGQEFIDQVLDSPASRSASKNFRYFTDLATKYHVMISTLFTTAPDMELYLAAKVLMQFPVLFGLAPQLDEIGHNSLDHYGFRGYLVAQWEPNPITVSSILKCVKCGSQYDLALNSGLITRESHYQDIAESGGTIFHAQPVSDWPPPQDTVMLVKDPSRYYKELQLVIDYLQKGRPRRWHCRKCSFLQGYPGSFIRHCCSQ